MDDQTQQQTPLQAATTKPKRTATAKQLAARFKPGQSGNPGGRPKGSASFVAELRQKLKGETGRQTAERIAATLLAVAQDPGHRRWFEAVKLLVERIDGAIPRQLTTNSTTKRVVLHVQDGAQDAQEATSRRADPATLDVEATQTLASKEVTSPASDNVH